MDSIDRTFVNALFTANYYRGYKALERYVSKAALGTLHQAGVTGYLREGFRPLDDVMGRFGFHAQSRPFVGWAVSYLEQAGLAQRRDGAYRLNVDVHAPDIDDDAKQILRFAPTACIFINLVQHVSANIQDFLTGRKKGEDILFSGKTLSLWDDYFNNNFHGYAVLNHGAAYGVTRWFPAMRGRRMLELGSGTSGATVKVFRMLRDNNLLDSVGSAVLTDIAPLLLDMGRKNIEENISPPPAYKQELLDINAPFEGQGLTEGPFGVVFGVNVLHAARDLGFSLGEIYRHLDKDGVLVIAETVRPAQCRPMPHEIIFNLLGNYYDVKTDPVMRPCHGFLTRESWILNLEAAGFREVEHITELDRHGQLDFDIRPLHSFIVLKGRK